MKPQTSQNSFAVGFPNFNVYILDPSVTRLEMLFFGGGALDMGEGGRRVRGLEKAPSCRLGGTPPPPRGGAGQPSEKP